MLLVRYSADCSVRFTVSLRKDGLYEIWFERLMTDARYPGEAWYTGICGDSRHLADTRERAVQIGEEGLRCFSTGEKREVKA